MRQTKENTELVKEKILEKAAEEFSRNGYAAANLQAIAEAAGISRGPLYYHFKNKEELFAATLHKVIQEQKDGYDRVLGMDAPIEEILRAEYLQCLSYSNTLLQTMSQEAELRAIPEYIEFDRWLYNRKKEVFTAAKARGELREDCEPNRLVTFLYIFYTGVMRMQERRESGFDLLDEYMMEHSADAYLELVRASFLAR